MKNIKHFIEESMVNEAKNKKMRTTVGDYLAWYFGAADFDEIDPIDDFQSTDFDPTSLEDHFKGSYTAQYEFLANHKNEKIVLYQEETEYDDVAVEFTVGGVTFTPVAVDFFKK